MWARVIKKAREANIVVVVASGNFSPGPNGNNFGLSDRGEVSIPGVNDVVTVGAVDDQDAIASFSRPIPGSLARNPGDVGFGKPEIVARITSYNVCYTKLLRRDAFGER